MSGHMAYMNLLIASIVVMSILVCGCPTQVGQPTPTPTTNSIISPASSVTTGVQTTITSPVTNTLSITVTPSKTIVTNTVTTTPTPAPTTTSTVRADMSELFYPSGWMGDFNDIKFDAHSTDNPHTGSDSVKITYSAARSEGKGWAGVYWLYPDNNWGTVNEGRDLTGHSRLTFWVRGAEGGEVAEFKVGGVEGTYKDSLFPARTSGVLTLVKDWKQYSIDLTGADLSKVMGGFCWVSSAAKNPSGCTFYLDDIYYEER